MTLNTARPSALGFFIMAKDEPVRYGALTCMRIDTEKLQVGRDRCIECGSKDAKHVVSGGPAIARFCGKDCPCCNRINLTATKAECEQVLFDLIQRNATQWESVSADQAYVIRKREAVDG